jgi:N-acetylglucosamine-6-phosphate deacetylase
MLFSEASVCAAAGVWSPGWVRTEGRSIAALGPGEPPEGEAQERIDAQGLWLVPGFIDLHVHGGDGADAMDADPEALRCMARFHAAHGVTAVLPTTWTATEAATMAALEAVAEAAGPVEGGATILGAHLEGPWLNRDRCGAQDADLIRPADPQEARRFLDTGVVRLVTLAPEVEGNRWVIGECRERSITVAAGHTQAGYEEMVEAVRLGVRHVTHTYNAMAPLGHRDPGTVGAALTLDDLRCELIADGVHVHPAAMALLARAKGTDGVVLVSDATRAAGLPDGPVDLGGRPAVSAGGALRLADGRLAGSVCTLDTARRVFAAATGWGPAELAAAASGNAAAALGLTAKGALAAGADADLVLLDAEGTVRLTMAEGRVVYRA